MCQCDQFPSKDHAYDSSGNEYWQEVIVITITGHNFKFFIIYISFTHVNTCRVWFQMVYIQSGALSLAHS